MTELSSDQRGVDEAADLWEGFPEETTLTAPNKAADTLTKLEQIVMGPQTPEQTRRVMIARAKLDPHGIGDWNLLKDALRKGEITQEEYDSVPRRGFLPSIRDMRIGQVASEVTDEDRGATLIDLNQLSDMLMTS